MIIPEGQNYFKFYEAATKQGVKITSRFPHVFIVTEKGALNWRGRRRTLSKGCGYEGKNFPFTAIGEMQAARWSSEGPPEPERLPGQRGPDVKKRKTGCGRKKKIRNE